jgi:outer membrane protein TolC
MKKVALGILITFSLSVRAQETVPLSLQDAVDAALRNNKEIILAGLDEESAQARFKQTDAVFLPQISLNYSAMSTNNPLNAFGFKLQQQAITPADFNPELLNDPSSTQNFMTKAEWQQPILNIDMLYARKAARQQSVAFEFKTKRRKEYLMFEVEKAYSHLQLSYQAKEVLTEAWHTVNSIYSTTHNKYEKGYLQKSDLLQVQVQVTTTESQLAEAKSNVQNASDYLSLLMGSKSGVLYSVAPIGETTLADSIETTVSDSRADFMAMQSAISAQDQMISSTRMSIVPNLNAFGQYLINDSDAFGFGSNSYLVGAQLSWSLFKGMSVQHKTTEQRIERDKMITQLSYQKEQSQLELNKAIRQFQDSKFALQQQTLAVTQATEALRILQNRYQQGLVTTNDLLQAQTLLSQQKLRQAQAYFQVNTTNAYLLFLSTTSEK